MASISLAPAPEVSRRATVMIVDDDGVFRALLTDALEAAGFEVLEARTVTIARRLAATKRVDAVVVDGLLPDSTGFAYIEELRALPSDLLIAFASAFWKDFGSHQKLRELSVDRIFTKPVQPTELCAWLSSCFPVEGEEVVVEVEPPDLVVPPGVTLEQLCAESH